jgi:hypothetical protein
VLKPPTPKGEHSVQKPDFQSFYLAITLVIYLLRGSKSPIFIGKKATKLWFSTEGSPLGVGGFNCIQKTEYQFLIQ